MEFKCYTLRNYDLQYLKRQLVTKNCSESYGVYSCSCRVAHNHGPFLAESDGAILEVGSAWFYLFAFCILFELRLTTTKLTNM